MQRLFASIRPLQAMMRSSQSAFVSPVMVSARRSLRSSISPRRPPARRPRAPAILCATHDPVPMPEEPSLPSWRQLSDTSGMPLILEDDLEEQFVRGSGPGGQKINKTASCVVLKHLPSGIIVRCQQTRSQMKNRELARKILQRKLDEAIRGKESLAAKELSKARARKARRRRKSIKKHFKSRRDKSQWDDMYE